MTNKVRSPISKAFQPEDTVATVEQYQDAQAHGTDEYAPMVTKFYELVTDSYEFGWGPSFHFAPNTGDESFEESLASHQFFLGDALGLKPGMSVLDIGCGVGGPQRSLAKNFGATITGLNISEYQLGKCDAYNKAAGLDDICRVLHGDFMSIPAEDGSFDAAYHIEAIPHAPDKKAVYAEIFRVLNPGAIFAGYDWCMTPSYNADNPEHGKIKHSIEYGNALPQIVSFSDIDHNLQSAGFELLETGDRALDSDRDSPWYRPLEGTVTTLRGLPRSRIGRKVAAVILRILESLHVVPNGAYETQNILNLAADSLVAGGRTGIFTPMYFHKARKPL